MKNAILTIKSWNVKNARKLKKRDKENDWEILENTLGTKKCAERLYDRIKDIDPRYIFVTHWSWMIPEEIWGNYETVLFHPADLPFGRGGTPIQNQIVRGIYDIKLTAFRVNEGIDTGPIYLKRDFNISEGNVDQILSRASKIYFEDMIPYILRERVTPVPQEGKVVQFKRRKPSQSNFLDEIRSNPEPRKVYDFIRMLDGEGYPRAYVPVGDKKLELYNASLEGNIVRAETRLVD